MTLSCIDTACFITLKSVRGCWLAGHTRRGFCQQNQISPEWNKSASARAPWADSSRAPSLCSGIAHKERASGSAQPPPPLHPPPPLLIHLTAIPSVRVLHQRGRRRERGAFTLWYLCFFIFYFAVSPPGPAPSADMEGVSSNRSMSYSRWSYDR